VTAQERAAVLALIRAARVALEEALRLVEAEPSDS
jgi:hypothetical protein